MELINTVLGYCGLGVALEKSFEMATPVLVYGDVEYAVFMFLVCVEGVKYIKIFLLHTFPKLRNED